jgi:hypothetical protein
MRPAPPTLLYQPRPLQRLLHPRVAQLNSVRLAQLLVKVPNAQIEIFLSI